MSAPHTRGPWSVKHASGETLIVRADGAVIARVGAATDMRANARLMAAGPEMLQAAKDAYRLLDSVAFVSQEGDTDTVLQQLRDAIAKATGSAT